MPVEIETVLVSHKDSGEVIRVNKHEFEAGAWSEYALDEGKPSLAEGLAKLDPENDAHWTKDGQPNLKVLGELIGVVGLKRDAVEAAQPGFVRPVTQ